MPYLGKKPTDFADVTESQTFKVTEDLTVDTDTLKVDSTNDRVGVNTADMADYYAKDFVVKAVDEGGITIVTADDEQAYIMWADGTSGNAQYRGYIGYDHASASEGMSIVSSDKIRFYTNDPATERWQILANGNLKAMTNGLGIDFSASEGGGASSSVLDDYEEGTWTPTAASGTLSVTRANYTKIGRQVNLNCTVKFTTASSSSNSFVLGGLPFASTADVEFIGSAMLNGQDVTSTSTYSYIYGGSATDTLQVYQNRDNASVVALPYNAFANNETIYLSVTYTTS
jgi:hypothetical protein